MQIFDIFFILNKWLTGYFIFTSCFQTADCTAQEEDDLLCGQPLMNPTRQFPPKSRANGVRATLRYGNKPYWPMQWYMNEEVFSVKNQNYSPSMKIAEFHNFNSKGVNVGVVIIGNSPVNCEHSEITQRCFPNSSAYSYHAKKCIFFGFFKSKVCIPNALATAVAGIIGMTDQLQNGGVGIAPKCKIGNIVIEPSTRGGSPEYGADKILSHSFDSGTYVFVHVWSLSSYEYQNRILHALDDIKMLNFNSKRQMKPHVMGSGDLGLFANSCQCNEYASADSMFVFGGVAYNGFLTSYSETCASLIGVTYSTSNGREFYNNFITITHSNNNWLTYAPKKTTAVSAAMGGGIIALINDIFFEAFARAPSISDIAFLLAFSCTSESLKGKNTLWFTNGIGKEYSPQAGFGLPQMDRVFALLRNWTPLESPIVYEFSRFNGSLTYRFNLVCFFEIANSQAHRYIQLITVELSAKLMKRGSLSVYLISPAGTVSCILEGRPFDIRKKKYKKLLLRSNHFMGETLQGQWSIRFYSYQEDSIPSYDKLREYCFPTQLQRMTPPPISQFHNPGYQQPITPVGTPNTVPQTVNPNTVPQVSSSQSAGQVVTGGDSSHKTAYPSSSPNPTSTTSNNSPEIPNGNSTPKNKDHDSKPDHQFFTQDGFRPAIETNPHFRPRTPKHSTDSANFQAPPAPNAQSWGNHPTVESHNGVSFTTSNCASKPYANHLDPNIIDQVNFRFLLIENLPSVLKVEPVVKNEKQTKLDFELIKAWVDFRHFLMVQTDPKNLGTSTVGLWEVYDFTNLFIEKLLSIQKNLKINSATPSPQEGLQKVFGSDLFSKPQISEINQATGGFVSHEPTANKGSQFAHGS